MKMRPCNSVDKVRLIRNFYEFILRKHQTKFSLLTKHKHIFVTSQPCFFIFSHNSKRPSNNNIHQNAINNNDVKRRRLFSTRKHQKQKKQQKQSNLNKNNDGHSSTAKDNNTSIHIFQQTFSTQATIIQSLLRCYLSRKSYHTKLKATVTIQSNVRAMIETKKLKRMKYSAIKIQSICRMRSKINEAMGMQLLMVCEAFYHCYEKLPSIPLPVSPMSTSLSRNTFAPSVHNFMEEFIMALLARSSSLARIKDSHGNLPLHTLLANTSHGLYLNPNIIQILITCYPEAAQEKNSIGDLPLHLSIRNCYSYGVVRILLESYPKGSSILDSRGQHPLRTALLKHYEHGENKSRGDDDRIILSLLDHIDSKVSVEVLDSVFLLIKKKKRVYFSNLEVVTMLTFIGHLYERIGNIDSALECFHTVLSLGKVRNRRHFPMCVCLECNPFMISRKWSD